MLSDAPGPTDPSQGEDPAHGLIFGRVLDGHGGCAAIGWEAASDWTPARPGEVLWLHLDRTHPEVERWLAARADLSEATHDVLVSNETRPRAYREGDALIAVARGINLNPGAEPEDMIAMQIWASATRVVSFRRRPLQTPRDALSTLEAGQGPLTAGDLVSDLLQRLVSKMNQSIVEMNDRIDQMEAEDEDLDVEAMLADIRDIRRNSLALKRYMSPQHEALLEIQRGAPAWLSETNRQEIRETIDRLRRYLEELDVSKESVLVLQDDLNNRAANRMNRTMYALSIVAAVFLPLSFITGLLGINVGGMPGVNSHIAFWVTVALLVAIFGVQYLIFKKLKWL
ncbi:MAG: zinc transporter ZntB [Alphaproteobacteria bacterium]|nr:zinc transporter ZntB [Alphaproteobacteria bacterium]